MKKPTPKTAKISTKTAVAKTSAKSTEKVAAKPKSVHKSSANGKKLGSSAHIGTLHFLLGGIVVPLAIVIIALTIAGFVISINNPEFNYQAYEAYLQNANNWGVVAATFVVGASILAWIGASASAEYIKRKYRIADPARAALIALYWLLIVYGLKLFLDLTTMSNDGEDTWSVVALPAYGVTTVAVAVFWLLVFFIASRHYLAREK